MLQVLQIFPKLFKCFLYVVFHNLESQNAGLVDTIVIKPEDSLMQKAERPSNYFYYSFTNIQAE